MNYFIADVRHLYRYAMHGEQPHNRNADRLLPRIIAVATEALFVGLTAAAFYSISPTLAITGLSEYSFFWIGGAFGAAMSVTKHYLDCKVDQYRPLSKIQFAAARVFTFMSSFATTYLVTKVAGLAFGVNFTCFFWMDAVLGSPIIGTVLVYEVLKSFSFEIIACFALVEAVISVRRANRDSIVFAPAIPLP